MEAFGRLGSTTQYLMIFLMKTPKMEVKYMSLLLLDGQISRSVAFLFLSDRYFGWIGAAEYGNG